jgi:hypothetical protein
MGFAVETALVLLELGSMRLIALGFTTLEVSIKNISSRKTMSVKDDMLNSAMALLDFFSPIQSVI